MISGNSVPAAGDRDRQLRDIEDIIAKLADVNRRLGVPARVAVAAGASDAEATVEG